MIDNILKYKIQKSEIKYVKKRNFRFESDPMISLYPPVSFKITFHLNS